MDNKFICTHREYRRYGEVKRVGVLMGLDFDDDAIVMVKRNKAKAITDIVEIKRDSKIE